MGTIRTLSYSHIIILFLGINLCSYTFTMQKTVEKSKDEGYVATTVNWLASSLISVCKQLVPNNNTFGFFKEPPISRSHNIAELLERCLRGEVDPNVVISEDSTLADVVLHFGTYPTVLFFLEHGARWKPNCIAKLSHYNGVCLPKPQEERFKRLKLLIESGYNVNSSFINSMNMSISP